jgi:hypothetical protein
MAESLPDYEKLGAFYLGRQVVDGRATDDLVLYDSADLTTHAVIIGMTGSGKTGLGVGLIEEAALDHVPVIAIDPKGDLGNLLLTFPDMSPGDFGPWIDPQAAAAAGQTPGDYAAGQATAWRQGLERSHQPLARIARLRAAADFGLYTPGSTAGRPLSVLASLAPPPPAVCADAELYREHVQGVVGGLLALAGIEADPLASREHVLLATMLDMAWQAGRTLSLADLVAAVPAPGIARIGVLDLDTFFPPKDRMALTLRLNNLLAAPGFTAWTAGEPLSAGRLLFTDAGRPRVSVLSIAHLGDAERLFFVTLLLNDLLAWVRTQPGTTSLRAILYMDEVFGYLPPTANPPTKPLLLTLLKQARAYGLGVVLATQNPVDLDYKALSNAGTWMIGRLQTAQDRNRVRDGLLAAATGALDAGSVDATLAGLGKRRFLLHNVHETAPVVFETRFTLSYLRGPLTRDDIRRLTASTGANDSLATAAPGAAGVPTAPAPTSAVGASATRPVLPPEVATAYLEARRAPGDGERLVYQPRVVAAARVVYLNATHGVDLRRDLLLAAEPTGTSLDWTAAEALEAAVESLQNTPAPDAAFAELPPGIGAAGVRRWQDQFRSWVRTDLPVTLYRSPRLKLTSAPDEGEGAFRARLQQVGREQRDLKAAQLRRKYAARFATLAERRRRAEQAVARQQEQASSATIDAAVSVGTAVLGALFGRKALSTTTLGKAGSAVRKAGNVQKQSADVARAGETVAALDAEVARLEAAVQAELDALDLGYDAQAELLKTIAVRPRANDVSLQFFGIGWLPYVEDPAGNITIAWTGSTGTGSQVT